MINENQELQMEWENRIPSHDFINVGLSVKESEKVISSLKKLDDEGVMEFIRERLTTSNGERWRFNMSGYDYDYSDRADSIPGTCTKENMEIVNLFADLGIYDYTEFLFLDTYKGSITLHLKKWGPDGEYEDVICGGMSTAEIIKQIFDLTIFSGGEKRRRSTMG